MKDRVVWFATPKNKVRSKYVFAEEEQVFLKKNLGNSSVTEDQEDEWCPINFQWIPVINLAERLK